MIKAVKWVSTFFGLTTALPKGQWRFLPLKAEVIKLSRKIVQL